MRCAKCGSETPIGHRCIVGDLEAIRNVDLSDHPLFKRETETAPEPREDVAVAEVLAAHRRVGRLGCRCGTYFRASAMDDAAMLAEHDAHIADALAPLIAERVRAAKAAAVESMAHLFRDMRCESITRYEAAALCDLRADSYRADRRAER